MGQLHPSKKWHDGEIYLNDNTVIRGKIKYDIPRDIVQVELGDKIKTYSAKLVARFSFIQGNIGVKRNFFTLPYSERFGYKEVPKFFEVITEGKMTLLAREYIAVRTTGTRGPYDRFSTSRAGGPRTLNYAYIAYNMFLLDHEGNMMPYNGRRKELYRILEEGDSADLKKFAKSNRLKLEKLRDVAKLVAHYNTLI